MLNGRERQRQPTCPLRETFARFGDAVSAWHRYTNRLGKWALSFLFFTRRTIVASGGEELLNAPQHHLSTDRGEQ